MWNETDLGASEMNYYQLQQRPVSSKEGEDVYMVGLEGSPLYELLLENQTMNSNNYFSQLDQLKAAFHERHQELVIRITQDRMFL